MLTDTSAHIATRYFLKSETDMNTNPDGQMVRRDIIMLGYHNGAEGGDVLSGDGEVLGTWCMDEEEWSHFKVVGDTEISSSAPSPWMLQDVIADWYVREKEILRIRDCGRP